MQHQRYYPMLAFSLALMVVLLVALLGLSPQQAAAGDQPNLGTVPSMTYDMGEEDPLDVWIEKDFEFDAGTGLGSYHIIVTNHGCEEDDDDEGFTQEAASKNAGDDECTAFNVVVTDDLNPLVNVLGSTVTQGAYAGGVWVVGDLDEGESASLWIDFQVTEEGRYYNEACAVYETDDDDDDEDDEGDEVCDEAEFIVSDRGVPDFVPERSPGGITDRGPRFAADLEAGKEVAVDGNTATYTITVENLGPSSTAKVQATDHLPDCLEFDSSDADRGSYNPDTWIWDIGALKVGETATLTITATITDACTGTVTNTVSVSRSSLPDPGDFFNLFDEGNAAANNSASASFDAGSGRVLDGTVFALGRNYPNPFNPMTIVPFAMAEEAHVSIRVYDLLGREVEVLLDERVPAGVHEVVFEASHLPTGVYLIRMQAVGIVQTQRVALMK